MNRLLRVLHLEDEPDYSDLVRALLEKEGYQVETDLVDNQPDFELALAPEKYDIILADYLLPAYNGLEAVRTAREKCPETPVLLVSGTIGEQAAIEGLKAGATDYVLKHWPERLVPSIRRALDEVEERRRRQCIERELARREDLFRALTENALDVLTIINPQGLFLYNSPSVKNMLGFEPHELIGRSAFTRIHPEDARKVEQVLECGLKNPANTITLQFRFQHQNGSWRYLEAVGQSRLDDPAVAGVVVNSRDVTDRKEAEEALRQSEQQYRLVFFGNPMPLVVLDHETLRFLEVNHAAVNQYGYSPEEFRSMTLKDLQPPAHAAATEAQVHHLLAAAAPGGIGFAGEWQHRRKDGRLIEVEIRWSPISFQGRSTALAMINDITRRKQIERRNEALSRLSYRLNSAASPSEAAEAIRAVTDELFSWDAFMLNVYCADRDRITPVVNMDTDRSGKRFIIPAEGSERAPSTRARHVLEHGAELILREEPIVMSADVEPIGDTTRPSASLMFAPVRNRAKAVGILSIQSYTPRAYCQADLALLQTLADHCGGALERIQTREALSRSEQRFRSLIESSPDAVFVEDFEGNVLDVNPAACRLHGVAREELIGRNVFELVPPERREMAARDFKALVDGRLQRVEGTSTTQDGRTVPVELRASRIEYEGKPAVLLQVRDMPGRKPA